VKIILYLEPHSEFYY